MKNAIYKSYGKKGEEVVNMNYAAIDRGSDVEKLKILLNGQILKLHMR
jgi:pyruvate-ferredoxin/flavodoxin oxidoreductase